MELRRKLEILADAAKYDASCASSGAKRARPQDGLGDATGMGICHSYTPDGRCVSLLKILLTNVCIYDCQYCVNRLSSDVERATFTPQEVVALTLNFYRRNYIEGLFLSSGIAKNPDATMERLIEVARSLREDHRFGGYIHLKVIANASAELIERAGRYADRLSANIELPTQADLDQLAPSKTVQSVTGAMTTIATEHEASKYQRKRSRKAPLFAPAGQSTQMVIGASPSPDATILATADALYKKHQLRRVYYSAFSPIPFADPRLPSKPAERMREHRLYQADWLLRFYGFSLDELIAPGANFSLEMDPKAQWALAHRERFPVDVNTAPKEMLLRVPGFGTQSVAKILRARRLGRLYLDDLARLGCAMNRARPFITAIDRDPLLKDLDSPALVEHVAPRKRGPRVAPTQLSLF